MKHLSAMTAMKKDLQQIYHTLRQIQASILTQECEEDTDTITDEPYKVVLFNDDYHTFEEVINQIIKATGCSRAKAEACTWEVHNKGKAIVYDGEITECLRVSAILEEINLKTEIQTC